MPGARAVFAEADPLVSWKIGETFQENTEWAKLDEEGYTIKRQFVEPQDLQELLDEAMLTDEHLWINLFNESAGRDEAYSPSRQHAKEVDAGKFVALRGWYDRVLRPHLEEAIPDNVFVTQKFSFPFFLKKKKPFGHK